MKSVIRLHDVQKKFVQAHNEFILFDKINMIFEQGQSYIIKGISGSGKSTLLNIIAGFESTTKGSVFFNETAIQQLSYAEREVMTREQFGIMFQQPYLLKELSVMENILIKASINKIDYAEERAWQLLKKVGLEQHAHQAPSTLSGGEQQRVSFVRALIHNPPFLIADEPTAHLDEENKHRLLTLLQEAVTLGMGLIITTHDQAVAASFQHILHLEQGQLYAGTRKI